MRPRNHVHYKRYKPKGTGMLHFCSWKCVRAWDGEREAELEAKRVTPEQRIAQLKEKIKKDTLMLKTGELSANERKTAQNRIHQTRRKIQMLEEEVYGYWTEGKNAGCEC